MKTEAKKLTVATVSKFYSRFTWMRRMRPARIMPTRGRLFACYTTTMTARIVYNLLNVSMR